MVLSAFDLQGRVALVSGAGQSIGKAIALGLTEAGADLLSGRIRTRDLRLDCEGFRRDLPTSRVQAGPPLAHPARTLEDWP
jgi:NAD(P)-dependent dehydrogenase (short-subunit alcohol dehydrogenase family)